MTAIELGRFIREKRKALGMNQGELALVSGTGTRFISELERGKDTCELGKTLKVLMNLGVELVLPPKKW